MVSMIVAVSDRNVIGKNNQLLWHLPADLKYFKSITEGHVVIMGRKTYESMGKPLKNRTNIIVTRQKDYIKDGVIVIHSLEDAIKKGKEFKDDEIFIIGGEDIYRQGLTYTDRIYMTRIFAEYEGDTFFPQLPEDFWKKTREERHKADEKNKHDYAFMVYERN